MLSYKAKVWGLKLVRSYFVIVYWVVDGFQQLSRNRHPNVFWIKYFINVFNGIEGLHEP